MLFLYPLEGDVFNRLIQVMLLRFFCKMSNINERSIFPWYQKVKSWIYILKHVTHIYSYLKNILSLNVYLFCDFLTIKTVFEIICFYF